MARSKVAQHRRRRTRSATTAATPDKIEVVATHLKNIYYNGFDRRGTAYRIARSNLRDFAEVQRIEAGTMKKLIDRVRRDGFTLYPIDKSDYGQANQWMFDDLANYKKLPLADDAAVSNAEQRSKTVC
jgi:hypothetical protein